MVPFNILLPSLSVSLLLIISFVCISTPTFGLPDEVFWDNDWPSDLTPTGSGTPLLEGTVLFAQSQIIPSKHGIDNDSQPHLTALRKTLVMLRPHDIDDPQVRMRLTVRDADGTIVSRKRRAKSILMEVPENIPKHDSWIEGNVEGIQFPTSLDSPLLVTGQGGINSVGNDPNSVGLTNLFNDDDATPTNEIKIKTADGSWLKDFYLPEGSTVPADSKIQFTCKSSWSIYVYYPNPQTGGWRMKNLKNGENLVVVLSPDNIWLASEDLEQNDFVFGHNFYTAILDPKWVAPGMTLEFFASSGQRGIIEAVVGGVTELLITTLDAGFLTEPRNEFTFRDDPTTNTEYFETTMASRLVVAQYESMHFTEIMLPNGILYDTASVDEGGVHSGDMRQHIGKILLSHGIDLANYGISSSLGQSESSHPFTCALLAAHNTVGLYENGEIIHGLSGGNGMITLWNSIGNEMSHEVGHNYGLGHNVGGFDGSVHRAADKINSSWGWDSRMNLFLPNFSPSNTENDQCLDDECESAFMGRYQYGKDAMAGGIPLWGSNRFTMYTPHVSTIIQESLENKAVWDPSSSTGFRKYNSNTRQMEEFINKANGQKVPRLYRVPVTTIVGYYDPNQVPDMESYVYPALHGAYGFVYKDDGGSTTGTTNGCELVVKTKKNGTLVFTLNTSVDPKGMNKFHVNVATKDIPNMASIYCNGNLLAKRTLDKPKKPKLSYTVNGPLFADVCEDKDLKWKNRKRDCDWVGNGRVKTVRKRCMRTYRKKKIYDWCPTTCGKVDRGHCEDEF